MLHRNRVWCVSIVETAEELARKLTEHTWTLCTGFCVAGHEQYLFLNDAISEDGAAEFAVIRGGLDSDRHIQIESITFSWCSDVDALGHIRATLRGDYDQSPFAHQVSIRLHRPEQHGRCPLCA